jgi:hypothetical protein
MLKRIICHWTAGSYNVNDVDKAHYHFIIDGNGRVVSGVHTPEDNLDVDDSHYAAHTRNCNTGAIGVSIAAMAEATEKPFNAGPYPLKKIQWDKMIEVVATLCKDYNIPIAPDTVLTHAEVQGRLGVEQRGKWDITRLPFDDSVKGPTEVGNKLRTEVADFGKFVVPTNQDYVTRKELAKLFYKIAKELES